MTKSTKTLSTNCPSCYARMRLNKRPRQGDIIVCRECEESLEVVRLSPLKVDWAYWGDKDSWTEIDYDDYDDYKYDQYNWD